MRTANKRDGESSRESFLDRIRRRAKDRRVGNRNLNVPEGTEFYKPKKSRESARIDIMPYPLSVKNHGYGQVGELWYEKTYYVHYQVGGDNTSCVCPSTVGKKCPICEYAANLRRQPKTPENEEVIKKLRPKQRQIFNVIDLAEPDKGIQIFEMAYFNFGAELEKELNEEEAQNSEFKSFVSLEEGYTLKVRWDEEQQAGGRAYLKAGRIDFLERKHPYPKGTVKETIDLDVVLVVLTYEEIERLFNGVEEEDEEQPTSPSKKRYKDDDDVAFPEGERTPRKHHDKDEDEDEETPPPKKRKRYEDEDEDEEAPPKRKRYKNDEDEDEEIPLPKRKKYRDEDEDEDEETPPKRKRYKNDEDEDDEELIPSKRKRR